MAKRIQKSLARTLFERSTQPQWADYAGGDSTIHKNDFSDPNFVRKAIFELIGDGQKFPVVLWAFDGKRLSHLNLWGNSKVYKEMAKAMSLLHPDSKAIFMSGAAKKMLLIAMDGKVLGQPHAIDHKSFNGNPANDWDFINSLPRLLHQIGKSDATYQQAKSAAASRARDYKAWVNINDKVFKAFDINKTHHDALKASPDTFGVAGVPSLVKALGVAEQKGWAAVSVHANGENYEATVFALNDTAAMKAARLLFTARYQAAPWISLTVRTNSDKRVYRGAKDIIAYLKGDNNVYL
jgi:hypothetical protein